MPPDANDIDQRIAALSDAEVRTALTTLVDALNDGDESQVVTILEAWGLGQVRAEDT